VLGSLADNGDWLWSVSMAHKAIVSGSPVRGCPGQSQSPFQKSPKGFSETVTALCQAGFYRQNLI